MKLCPICGRPLKDGEVCDCQRPHKDAREANAYPEIKPEVEAVPAAPKKESAFLKALKNIPIAFFSYLKNSKAVLRIARGKKDWLLPLMYTVILFLVNFILGICFFARMTSGTYFAGLGVLANVFGGYAFSFNIGFVLISATVMTTVEAALYVGFRLIPQIFFAKKPFLNALLDSFIEFGFHSTIVSSLLFTGAVLGLISAWFIAPFAGLAASYLVVTYVTATAKDTEDFKNKLIINAITAGSVMVAVAVVFWIMYLMCSLNYSIPAYNYSSAIDLIGSLW